MFPKGVGGRLHEMHETAVGRVVDGTGASMLEKTGFSGISPHEVIIVIGHGPQWKIWTLMTLDAFVSCLLKGHLTTL